MSRELALPARADSRESPSGYRVRRAAADAGPGKDDPTRTRGHARYEPRTVGSDTQPSQGGGHGAPRGWHREPAGRVRAAAWTRPRASARRLFTHGATFQARWTVLYAIPSRMAGRAGACYSCFSCNNAREGTRLLVQVRDNNVDQALRVLKKKMQREGVFREMKQRKYYEKPSEKRVREQAEAVRRARKLARKKAQRE